MTWGSRHLFTCGNTLQSDTATPDKLFLLKHPSQMPCGMQVISFAPILKTDVISPPCLWHLMNRRENDRSAWKPSLHVLLLVTLRSHLKSSATCVESLPWHLQSKTETLQSHLTLLGHSAPTQLMMSRPTYAALQNAVCSFEPLRDTCERGRKS